MTNIDFGIVISWCRYAFLTSKERDSESGLDYFGARYYSAAAARFTGCDRSPFKKHQLVNPQDLNRYAYTSDNPLRYIDPNGLDKIEVVVQAYTPKDQVVLNPPVGKKRYFNGNFDDKGNVRSIPTAGQAPIPGDFKTSQTVIVETSSSRNGGSPVYTSPDNPTGIKNETGKAIEYNAKGEKIGEAHAEGKTLGGEVTGSGASINVHVHGNESNPLVPGSTGITYNFDVRITTDQNGSVNVSATGTHDAFPRYVISAVDLDKPGAAPVVVYPYDPKAAGASVNDLSPVLRQLPGGKGPVTVNAPPQKVN